MAENTPTVEEMLAKRGEHVKAIAEIDASLKRIQDQIQKALGKPEAPVKRGRKPGRRPGRQPGATPPPAQAPDEDKKKLLAAMKEIGGSMRSGEAFEKAKLEKNQGKKAMAALKADGAVKISGPWISLA